MNSRRFVGARAGEYRTILADPPWPEQGSGKIKRGADKHYALMSVEHIAALPVAEIAGPNAHLYLWVTNNHLPAGLVVMERWGFRYVTVITWIKDRQGLGQYFRGITEHLLFGVKGSLPYKVIEGKRAQGMTYIRSPRRRHSEKPAALYRVAERVSYEPRIELFARSRRPGWDAWGNAVDGDVMLSTDGAVRTDTGNFAELDPDRQLRLWATT